MKPTKSEPAAGGRKKQPSPKKDGSGTIHFNEWIEETIKHRKEVQEWYRQNNINYHPPEKTQAIPGVYQLRPTDKQIDIKYLRKDSEAIPELTAETRIGELLELLWADPDFWQIIHDGEDIFFINSYIARKYGLCLPIIPVGVWREIAKSNHLRDRLFKFHRDDGEIRLDGGGDRTSLGFAWNTKLTQEDLGRLLWDFLVYPGLDHRHTVAALRWPINQLEALRLATQRLERALIWSTANPGVIPPPFASNPRHRKGDIGRVRAVEEMVKRLLKNPELSNYHLAGSTPCDPMDSVLKIVAVARRLMELREGKAVRRYSEQRDGKTIGRKPRRPKKIR